MDEEQRKRVSDAIKLRADLSLVQTIQCTWWDHVLEQDEGGEAGSLLALKEEVNASLWKLIERLHTELRQYDDLLHSPEMRARFARVETELADA